MALGAMDKIRLGRQLNSMIQDSAEATGLRKITIGRQINALLIQLGYGGPPANPVNASEAQPQPAEGGENKPVDSNQPAIVMAFLNGDFNAQESGEFTNTLTRLEPYLNVFLTMEDVVAGASDWLREKYPEAA